MVKAELQADGKTKLTGRKPDEVAIVPWWPCGPSALRKFAPNAPRKWLNECAEVGNDLLVSDHIANSR